MSFEILEEMILLRASFLLDRIFSGMNLTFEQALDLLRNHNNFTTLQDKEMREVLVAAIDNLVDFAAAQEYTLVRDLPHEVDIEHPEIYEHICKKYNETYAGIENEDVLHAAAIAAWWIHIPEDTLITYMTQGDERVRAWHLSLEGFSASKREFPDALIPPIEHGCRCYLVNNGSTSLIQGTLKRNSGSERKVNPVFSESLSKKGRIFSPAHPYFQIPLPEKLQKAVKRIKDKLYL